MSNNFEDVRLGRQSFPFSTLIPVSSREPSANGSGITPGAFQRKGLLPINCTQAHQRRQSGRSSHFTIPCGGSQRSLGAGWHIFVLVHPSGSALATVCNPSNIYPGFQLRLQFSPGLVLASTTLSSALAFHFYPFCFPSSIRRESLVTSITCSSQHVRGKKNHRPQSVHAFTILILFVSTLLLTVFGFSSSGDAMLKTLPSLSPNPLGTPGSTRVES